MEQSHALVGFSCSSFLWRGYTRTERTGPRTLSARLPSMAPSPTFPSLPWDARFPGEDRMRLWGEMSWARQHWMCFTYMHHKSRLWHRVDDSTETATGQAFWASSSDTSGKFSRLKKGFRLKIKVDFFSVYLNTIFICRMYVERISG